MRRFDFDPVVYLRAMDKMLKRKDRGQIGFTLDDLEWSAKCWEHIAIAGMGRDEFVHERDRYRHLLKQLKDGMVEHQEDGVMVMHAEDWPHPRTVKAAIEAMERAQIKTVKITDRPY